MDTALDNFLIHRVVLLKCCFHVETLSIWKNDEADAVFDSSTVKLLYLLAVLAYNVITVGILIGSRTAC